LCGRGVLQDAGVEFATGDSARNVVVVTDKLVRTESFERHAGVYHDGALQDGRRVTKGEGLAGEIRDRTDGAVIARGDHEAQGALPRGHAFDQHARLSGTLRLDIGHRGEVGDVDRTGSHFVRCPGQIGRQAQLHGSPEFVREVVGERLQPLIHGARDIHCHGPEVKLGCIGRERTRACPGQHQGRHRGCDTFTHPAFQRTWVR